MTRRQRWTWTLLVLAAAALPAASAGEIILLRDGSSLKGRLTHVDGDTLTVRLAIGVPVKIHREQVVSILFDESSAPPALPVPATSPGTAAGGTGTIAVTFKDRDVSSKITIEKKKDWDAKVASNHIVTRFVVGGHTVYSAVDTTMDKTIYHGHERQLENDARLGDFEVVVPAGTHVCTLVVGNADMETFADAFDPAPLNVVMQFEEIVVRPGGRVSVEIGIERGTMGLGRPTFYQVD